jgi:hypothetical protein
MIPEKREKNNENESLTSVQYTKIVFSRMKNMPPRV